MRRPDPAARRVLAAFAGVGTRVHTLGRWYTCPVDAVAEVVPEGGWILDIGCGHGLVSFVLAERSPDRRVVGIDIDPDKVRAARLAAARLAAARRGRTARVGESERRPGRVDIALVGRGGAREVLREGVDHRGGWDAVVIVDVVYLLGAAEAEGLVRAAARSLRPGGRVVVKEMDNRPRWKVLWVRAQEFVATRVIRATAGDHVELIPPEDLRAWLESEGLVVREFAAGRGSPHPHLILVGDEGGQADRITRGSTHDS